MCRIRFLTFALFSAVCLAGPLPTLRAAITYTGDLEAGSPPAPSNPNTWTSSTTGYIGYISAGTVTVDSGSTIASSNGVIGYNSGVTGMVTVTGTGSMWNSNGTLDVGCGGTGTLNITNGAEVSGRGGEGNNIGNIGFNANSTGTVTVGGTDSNGNNATWTNLSGLNIGYYGSGLLNINSGGGVNVTGSTLFGVGGGTATGAINFNGGTLTTGFLQARRPN